MVDKMKKCPKCGKKYHDSDNFCIECGAMLRPEGGQVPQHTKELQKKVSILEKKITKMPKPAPARDVGSLKSKVATLEKKMGDSTSTLKASIRDVDKKAEMLGKVKVTPESDSVTIVNEISSLQKKIDELNQSISALRTQMPRSEHILMEIEEKLRNTSGAIFTKQEHEIGEMKKRLQMMETRVQEAEKNVEEDIEKMKRQSAESELPKFLNEVKENKKKIEALEAMKTEFDEIKKRSASFNAKEMKENILTEFEKINTDLVESIEKKRSEIERIEEETARMRDGIESLKNIEDKIKGMDSENISRDLEILKTKTKWLEEQVEGLNMKPLHERIKELELELKRVTSASPLVVE